MRWEAHLGFHFKLIVFVRDFEWADCIANPFSEQGMMIFHLTGSRWDHPSMMEIQWPTPQAQLPQEFLQMMNHPRNVVDDTVFVNPGFLCRSVRFSVRSGRKGGTPPSASNVGNIGTEWIGNRLSRGWNWIMNSGSSHYHGSVEYDLSL